ncbi:DUF4173 domain-containing protein [uncultured Hymenobacter sp.]|uniref:DUF4153 domain-containing protein n=1 Tax=uncultured Hymenobacter sp. TaxID=170016 RepID=UPI0035CA1A21
MSVKPGYRAPALLATVLVPLGAVLCDYLFYSEAAGFNFLVYTAFILIVQLARLPRHAAVWRAWAFWVGVGGSLLGAGLVAWYGSTAAVLACIVSLLLVLGQLNQPGLRLLSNALLTALSSGWRAGAAVWRTWRQPGQASAGRERLRRGWFYGRLLGVPLGLLGVFHLLFALANPVYAELSGRMLAVLGEWLGRLLPDISLPHLLFFGVSFFVAAGALVVVPVYYFADHESRLGDFIRRQRDSVASLGVRWPDFRLRAFRSLDLRKEYYVALAVFGLLNALLLVVNIIDINLLWFGFTPPAGFDLTQFVHEGTYVLIVSILLAAGIMLWFFRRNLNFYAPGRRWLRGAATVWLAQNAVLAVSVGLRNYYYILHTGLAYKRIGVCFFLLLTLFGLGTVGLKIWQRRSAFSLFRLNAWAAYAVLLLLAAGNWEIWMARYNLQSRFRTLDIGFLLDMPPRVLPELLAQRAVLTQAATLVGTDSYGRFEVISLESAQARLAAKEQEFRADFPRLNLQSRTVSGWWANRELNGFK